MAALPTPRPARIPWNGFPDVYIVADEKTVRAHPDYVQAKAGNVQEAASAAKRLAADNWTPTVQAEIEKYPIEGCYLVPVHAMESGGLNRIPAAFAELLAEKLGLMVELSIVQANIVNHTGASGWARIARPPVFAGQVVAGRNFVLADDFVGQGGTLANLRGYITSNGGTVKAAITLTGKPYSAKLSLANDTLETLRAKHGKEIEEWWHGVFGYDFEGLTESEARYLLRAEDADTIRARLSEAGLATDS